MLFIFLLLNFDFFQARFSLCSFSFFSVSEKDIPGCLSVCCSRDNCDRGCRSRQKPDFSKYRQGYHVGSGQLVTLFTGYETSVPKKTRPPFQKNPFLFHYFVIALCHKQRHFPTKNPGPNAKEIQNVSKKSFKLNVEKTKLNLS